MSGPAGRHSRNEVIDAYRAILIYAVLTYHYLLRWAPPLHTPNLYGYNTVYSPNWEIGAHGVEVFFVISGLVITMTVLRSHDALDFAFRRFSRLHPTAVVCSLLTFIVTTLVGPAEFKRSVGDMLGSMTLIVPAFHGRLIDGAYWSLIVEVKFYLLVAVSFFFLRERFWLAVVALAIAEFLCRIFAFHRGIMDGPLIGNFVSLFAIGMAAWYAIFEKRAAPAIWLSVAATLTLPATMSILTIDHEPALSVQIAVVAAIALLIVLLAFGAKIPLGPLPYLGRISYALYLTHQNIGVTIIGLVKRGTHCPDIAAFLLAAVLMTALAAFLFHFIEMPAQEWLRGHYLRRRPHLAPVPQLAGEA